MWIHRFNDLIESLQWQHQLAVDIEPSNLRLHAPEISAFQGRSSRKWHATPHTRSNGSLISVA
jgi:hypothetical protein